MGNYKLKLNPFTGKLDLTLEGENYLKKSGDTADTAVDFSFPFDANYRMHIDGANGFLRLRNDLTGLYNNLFGYGMILQNGNDQISLQTGSPYPGLNFQNATYRFTLETNWGSGVLRAAANSNTYGLQLWGGGSNGAGFQLSFGDNFSIGNPYVCIMEDGGTDTDILQLYGQKGVRQYTSSLVSTPVTTCTQTGRLGVNNTLPSYPCDVTGDINASGDYRKSGTIGYLTSAFGAASGVAPTLANCRTRNLTINGTTVKVVVEL